MAVEGEKKHADKVVITYGTPDNKRKLELVWETENGETQKGKHTGFCGKHTHTHFSIKYTRLRLKQESFPRNTKYKCYQKC